MKKHLLLILALLAFVLPARAESDPDMLYNFKNNSTDSDYGTNFNTSVDIDNVIANVTGVDVTDFGANAKNYVSAITEATNVAYDSKGGVYMKAGGKLTFTLKKGYKVTRYQFMGQQLNATTATITLNGISFDGPTNTQAEGQFSRLYPVPSSVTTVNSITISSNADVYIKSVGIYIEAEDTPTPEKCATPVFSPASGTFGAGKEITVTCSTPGATINIIDGKDFDINLTSGQTFNLPTAEGEYYYIAVATATGYEASETADASYTVTAPVHNEVAPKISFSHEDQKVFASEEEIDVTLTLNHDVYPVPNVIYYTLDGFMAHNTLETGTPGATPAGHVLEAAVNPSTLSGTVRIERSHREALNHRAVTINAYTFNTAGNDVAAATYIFNDNSAPLPDPKPTTITATVTMANQGWTSGPYSASSKNATWTSDEIVALDNATLSFETSVTISVNSNYPRYYTKTPAGLRIYGTSYNKITIKTPTGYVFKSVKPTFEGKNSPKFYLGDFSDETNRVEMTSGQEYTLTNSASSIMLSANAGQIGLGSVVFVLEKTAAKAAVAPTTIKTATGDVYTLVTSANDLKAGDIVVIAANTNSKYYAMSTSTTKDKVNGTEVSVKDNKIDWVSDLNEITLEDKSGSFILKCSQGYNNNPYLSSVSTSSNNIKFVAKNSAPAVTLTFQDDNSVKINFSGTTSKLLLCNYNNNSPMFRNYNSGSWSSYGKTYIFKKTAGGNPDPTVEAPVISLSERANTTEPVTVTIDCATADAAVKYTVKKDGTTVADNLTYDPASKPVYSAVGSYTVDATATLGTASANATQATFEITEPEKPTVATPEITLSTQAKPSDPVTVTIDCATDGATINYTVTKDGTTVADNLTYDPASKPVFSEVGSYTVNATASKEGMNPANATPANFTIEKLVEVVEELFFVMDQNLWDVDGAYPETVVPFEYKGNNTYDLDITKIPAKGWYMNKNGIWTAIEHGFRGNFYVRDGKANHKGLVFGATGTVADATFATRAAAAGNQMVEPHTKYNMYVVNEGKTHKVFTTIDDNSSKAFTDGTIRVTHTPGNKDAAKTMTLEILAEDNQTTGVDSITAEDAASDADARFFNLQGVEVPADRLAPGIYIRQAGSKATKVLVK